MGYEAAITLGLANLQCNNSLAIISFPQIKRARVHFEGIVWVGYGISIIKKISFGHFFFNHLDIRSFYMMLSLVISYKVGLSYIIH